MKKVLFIICTMLSLQVQAQNSNYNYQGVARNNSGNPLPNQNIGLRLSILDGGISGPVMYQETHSVVTNGSGLFQILVGSGTVVSGGVDTINWMAADRYLKVEMDPAGGSSYVDLGAKKMAMVPLAQHSKHAEHMYIYGSGTTNADKMIIGHSPQFPNWGLAYDDGQDAMVFTSNGGADGVTIHLSDGVLTIPGGNPVQGKVLSAATSTGMTTWVDRNTVISTLVPPGCQSLANVTTTFQKIADLGTFNKVSAGTIIEIDFPTVFMVNSFAGGATGVTYELRIDNNPSAVGRATILVRDPGVNITTTIHGIFTGLSAGTHTISLWARSALGTASGAYYDPGCFNSINVNGIYIKEMY